MKPEQIGTEMWSLRRDYNDQYLKMDIGSPFAKEYNDRMEDYWVKTGRTLDPQSVILQILIDDFNIRNR